MIISPNRRFVFVHVHKCAGTSIETALSTQLTANDLVIGSTPGGERNQVFLTRLVALKKHSSAHDAIQVIGEDLWKTLFTFAFVREPVDRLFSLYSYSRGLAKRNPLTPAERTAFEADGSLPNRAPYKFRAVQAALRAKSFDGFICQPGLWQDAGARPQWRSLCDEEGRLLVQFVGKVENIGADWAKVQERLGVKVELGVQNKSGESAREPLSPAAWALIRKHYQRDYRLFNYPVPPEMAAAPAPKAGGAGAGKPDGAKPKPGEKAKAKVAKAQA